MAEVKPLPPAPVARSRASVPPAGSRFGRWEVLAEADPIRVEDKKMRRGWSLHTAVRVRCSCERGTERVVLLVSLTRKRGSKSCGCLQREAAAAQKPSLLHGGRRLPEYQVWCAMRRRCTKESDPFYESYGGRGIRVAQAWEKSFAVFLADMGRRPSPAHMLERIDNEGHYEPGNCRWALPVNQARNRRSTCWVEYQGRRMSLAEAAELAGVPYKRAWKQHKQGLFPPAAEVA